MSKRTVFGRIRGAEINGYDRTFTIELTRDCLRYRQRSSRKVSTISFNRLINSGGLTKKLGRVSFTFTLTEIGLEVRESSKKQVRIIPYCKLLNQANDEPFLFPEMVVVAK